MPKHRWSDRLEDGANTTRRTCQRCGMLKITRHEPDNWPPHWVEFEFEGRRVPAVKTPVCEAA
jgi:hypothetical protein